MLPIYMKVYFQIYINIKIAYHISKENHRIQRIMAITFCIAT